MNKKVSFTVPIEEPLVSGDARGGIAQIFLVALEDVVERRGVQPAQNVRLMAALPALSCTHQTKIYESLLDLIFKCFVYSDKKILALDPD
jgi:hypothetical protein